MTAYPASLGVYFPETETRFRHSMLLQRRAEDSHPQSKIGFNGRVGDVGRCYGGVVFLC